MGAKVHYHGMRGVTEPSRLALRKTLAHRGSTNVTLVCYTWDSPSPVYCGWIIEHTAPRSPYYGLTVIKDGFAAGYSGEGPRGLLDAVAAVVESKNDPDTLIKMKVARVPRALAQDLFNRELRPEQIRGYFTAEAPRLRVVWGLDLGMQATVAFKDPQTLVIRAGAGVPQVLWDKRDSAGLEYQTAAVMRIKMARAALDPDHDHPAGYAPAIARKEAP